MTEVRTSHDQAASRRDAVDAATGFWRVTTTQGSGQCLIALNGQAAGGDYGVHIESCAIQVLAGITAWRPTDDGFELLRAGKTAGLSFRQTDVDHFESRDGVLKVSRAAVP